MLIKSDEVDKYKKMMDDQSLMTKREYELISSSFYELALQFISVKNELSRKVNNNTNAKSWLEIERAKIFPFEK